MAVIWRGSLARGQLHFQEIRSRGGDSLTTELHFSFPEKKSLQMHSKTLPHPKTRRPGGAHCSAAQLCTSRGQAVQMQRGKHRNTGGQWLCFFAELFCSLSRYQNRIWEVTYQACMRACRLAPSCKPRLVSGYFRCALKLGGSSCSCSP